MKQALEVKNLLSGDINFFDMVCKIKIMKIKINQK